MTIDLTVLPAADCQGNPICIGAGIVNGVSGAVNFAADPFGSMFQALKNTAEGLAHDVLPAITKATLPDLSASWFLNAYAVSFALAIFVWVVILIVQAVKVARGSLAGRELVDSLGPQSFFFLGGAMFGPLIGSMIVNFFRSLTDVLIQWGIGDSYTHTATQIETMIQNADPATMTGGVLAGCLVMFCMVIGLMLVVLVLIVQLVTLYFTGVLIPLGLVWLTDPARRQSMGLRLIWVWLGLLAAHPLLFLLLGFAFNMIGGVTVSIGTADSPLAVLVQFIVAIIALFAATLSPLLLLKFAPVFPGPTGASGPSIGGNNAIGPKNMTDAGQKFGSDAPSSGGAGNKTGDAPAVAEETPIGGNLAGVAAGKSASAGAADAGGLAGAGSSAGAGAGAAGEAAGATELAEAGVAAGAAESATGVGAAIGIPTIIAAAGAEVAGKAVDVGHSAVGTAADHMEDDTGGTIGEARP